MMPACPPPAPNPFRAPPRPVSNPMPALWLSPSRHASARWHLAEGNAAEDPSFRWGDVKSHRIN